MGIMEKNMETTILGYSYPISPFLGTLNSRRRIITGIQNGTIILTTTQIPHEACIRRNWTTPCCANISDD